MYKSYTTFDKVITKYFISFDTILNYFLNFIFGLLLVYRKKMDLYLSCIPGPFKHISPGMWVYLDCLGLATYKIILSVNKDIFTSSNMYTTFFFLVPYCISSTLLRRNDKSRHSCLVSDFREKHSLIRHELRC